jgi:3-oxoacyl-[acyl-carrier-protein] synthase-3
MRRSVVLSTGAYLPQRVVTNHELATQIDTSDEWIVERTGIRQRHLAANDELTSDLAFHAAADAIARAGIDAQSVDLVVVATATPDDTLPATATKVQHKLGIKHGAAFDLNAACSGFVYALSVVDAMLKTGQANRALVIGAEIFSRIIDWKDRTTCILFGDGAAAMLLEAREENHRGILASRIYSDGAFGSMLATNGGVASNQKAGVLSMAGKEVFRHAVSKMPEATLASLADAGLTTADIDWVVPHQANLRILASVGEKLGLPSEKLIATVPQHANTSAASIPLALHVAATDGRLKPGQLIACPAMGAGFTWGCALLRW